jgi:hypothetical protein
MRGGDERSGSLFSYVDLEARVGKSHPLRAIRSIVNEALSALAVEFSALYSPIGRPSIPPEKLLRAMLLQAFYSIRSERQLMERVRAANAGRAPRGPPRRSSERAERMIRCEPKKRPAPLKARASKIAASGSLD